MLMGGRFVIGLGGGASSVAVPMYIGEISPPNLRGAFGTYFQVTLPCFVVSHPPFFFSSSFSSF